MITKPSHWTVGNTTKDGFTIARVRTFFVVLKKHVEGKPSEWAVELPDGKRVAAKSSADAGEKGRAYRDKQLAKGVAVARAPRMAKAPAKKTTAKKAQPKRATATK